MTWSPNRLSHVPTDELFTVLCVIENVRSASPEQAAVHCAFGNAGDMFDGPRANRKLDEWACTHTQVLIAWTMRERERMKHLVRSPYRDTTPPRPTDARRDFKRPAGLGTLRAPPYVPIPRHHPGHHGRLP